MKTLFFAITALAAPLAAPLCAQEVTQSNPPAAPTPPPVVQSAENPAPTPNPTPAPAASPANSPAPAEATPTPDLSPTPAPTPTISEIVDSLSAADVREAIGALKTNYIQPSAVSEDEIGRATIQGLLARLGPGVSILTAPPAEERAPQPFLAEILDEQVGYLRLGSLTPENLAEMDAALDGFSKKNIEAVILDLRATPRSANFDLAADVIRRFSAKGKLLFTLKKPGAKQERMFTSNQEPKFKGFIAALVDPDVAGAAEVVAGGLRAESGAVVLGEPTAGAPVEFSETPLRNGRVLRVAVAEIVIANDPKLFPDGIEPDLEIPFDADAKAEVFKQSREKGVGQFVFETERPRFNEAALVSGSNPELDAFQTDRENGGTPHPPLRDPVIQRALDLAASVAIFRNRKGR
jgi:hypothetical protein